MNGTKEQYSDWYKNKPEDKIWWLDRLNGIGEFIFSFDKKKSYNLFYDFPHNLTKNEVAIFTNENPYWAEFFSDRMK